MNHSFKSSIINKDKCVLCSYDEKSHGPNAECECCPAIGEVNIYKGMLMCSDCQAKEVELTTLNSTPQAQAERVIAVNADANKNQQVNQVIARSQDIDNSIELRTDIFNAETIAICDLRDAIESDESITNKNFALASELDKRYKHLKDVIFGLTQKVVDEANRQKAIQVYLNGLANSLRAEEREKLKLNDISYKPKEIKPIKAKSIKTTSKKIDKVELRKVASELGVSEFTLQMLIVAKGCSIEEAANKIRRSIAESKSIDN